MGKLNNRTALVTGGNGESVQRLLGDWLKKVPMWLSTIRHQVHLKKRKL